MNNVQKDRGYSFVELIITIAIMAVLVGMLSPNILRYVETTRESKDAAAIGEFINELYLAASDIDNWYGISGDLEFHYNSSTESLSTTPITGSNGFSEEVAAIVGGDIKLESKKWKDADLVINVSPVWDTIHVSGNLPSDFYFPNCTIVP